MSTQRESTTALAVALRFEPGTPWEATKRELFLTAEAMDCCGHWQAMMSDLREQGQHGIVEQILTGPSMADVVGKYLPISERAVRNAIDEELLK